MTASGVLRALFGRTARVEFDDDTWRRVLACAPLFEGMDSGEQQRLRNLSDAFIAQKSIELAGGLLPTPGLPVSLAVQACLPVLNLGIDWYREWRTVLVYPGDFVARHEYVDEDGVVHQMERPLSGEAWPDGPVVLSLEGIEEGLAGEYADNVVIHEMAHKLDLSNGSANGMPSLHLDMNREQWTRALSGAYEDLCDAVARGREAPFDEYATEDPGEFFAVMSEAFFVEPDALLDIYPDVYRQFVAFYRQDPVQRRARPGEGS